MTDDTPPKTDHRRTIAVSIAIATVVIAGAIIFSRLSSRLEQPAAAPVARSAMPRLERLTTDSKSYAPAISLDGRFVACRVAESEHQTVWLRNIATGSVVQVLPPDDGGYYSLNFSRDGNELLYKTLRRKSDNGTILRALSRRSTAASGRERLERLQPLARRA